MKDLEVRKASGVTASVLHESKAVSIRQDDVAIYLGPHEVEELAKWLQGVIDERGDS